ncbi:MAG: precorrin-2 C(20)-methyltransferase, partial [Gammaproteobacteria bacterium]
LYSTFIYLQEEARSRWPEVRIEVIPGVSSITAVPAVTGIPLADGQERIAILPGTYGLQDLVEVLRRFDTVVLMKIGAELPRIIAALEAERLLDRAVYVSRATMREQRIVRDLREVGTERGDCFAMVVVSRKERSGLLAGTVPLRELAG